jgi:DNA-binding response OmpR family regulator
MEKECILVVDDEEGLLQLVKMRLTAMGFAVIAKISSMAANPPRASANCRPYQAISMDQIWT